MKLKVEQVADVNKAMFQKAAAHAIGFHRGLKRAGLWLQRESQLVVPVDTGALKNSANTRAEGSGFDTVVTVSYGTEYAVYVHEDAAATHKPGKQDKYLEEPALRGHKKMTEIVRRSIPK